MKKLFIFLFAFVALIGLIFANKKVDAQSSAVVQTPVTIIGDSLTVGASRYYSTLFATIAPPIVSQQGQGWDWGEKQLEQINSTGQLSPTLLFALGTNNDSLTSAQIDNVVNNSGNSQIFFVTVYDGTKPNWASAVNTALQNAQAAHPDRIHLIDWYGLASKNPQWFKTDPQQIHPVDGDGYQRYANLIASTVAGTSPSPSSSNPSSNSLPAGSYETDSQSVMTRVGNPSAGLSPDGKHVCPIQEKFIPFPGSYANIGQGQYSYACWHADTPPNYTHCAIDVGVYPGGGNAEHAAIGGIATQEFTTGCGHFVSLEGDDGVTYLYCHMHDWAIPNNPRGTRVNTGDVLGYAASSAETSSGNNGVAHLHIQGTTNGDPYHPNVAMGPKLDQWCSNNVCGGKQSSCPEGI